MRTLDLYEDAEGKHRWRVTAENGEIVDASSQGFANRTEARANAWRSRDSLDEALRNLSGADGEDARKLHPSVRGLLKHFSYDHLPPHLQAISKPFCFLAHDVAWNLGLSGAELTAGLRKLLEAKDCAVRAVL